MLGGKVDARHGHIAKDRVNDLRIRRTTAALFHLGIVQREQLIEPGEQLCTRRRHVMATHSCARRDIDLSRVPSTCYGMLYNEMGGTRAAATAAGASEPL